MKSEFFVGVGCQPAQWLPFAVLRHSILKHARRPVQVEPLYRYGIEIPVPRDARKRQKTPFSFQRFLIPEIRGFRGTAVYLDSDMLVFDDIGRLFEFDFGEANILAVPRETSVMVLDCHRLQWNIRDLVADLDAEGLSYDSLMTCRSVARVRYELPLRWNWLDNSGSCMPADVALLHYTVTSSQPWVSAGHPLGDLWMESLFSAISAGDIRQSDIDDAVQQGMVRPSLLFQVKHRVSRKADIPPDVIRQDAPFADYCRSVHYLIVDGFRGQASIRT